MALISHFPLPKTLHSSKQFPVDGVVIPRRTETRHLGVVLSVDLRWNSHIDHLLSVTAGAVYLCQKLAYQHRLPSLAIRRFYIAFVRPRLEYCKAAWCGLTRKLIQALRLEKVQVRVARSRAVVRCPAGSRSQVLQDVGLPTLSWRRREHCLCLLWKLVNGIGPPALPGLQLRHLVHRLFYALLIHCSSLFACPLVVSHLSCATLSPFGISFLRL